MGKTTNELETGLAAGKARVLDVRSAAEYRSGHIEGAVHLPIEELEKLTHYPAGEDGTELWLVCQSGKRAERARLHLAGLGVAGCVLENGMNAWQEAGLPVVREKGAPLPLIRQVQIIIGLVNLAGLALGWRHTPLWLAVPAFTSCGLLAAGITGRCGLAILLAKMPWNK